MATLQLDQEIVEQVITTALAAISGVTFIPQGRRQPAVSDTTAQKFCRIVKVSCDGIGRAVLDSEPDRADVVVVVNCYVNRVATRANAYAIQDCMNRVAAVLAPVRMVNSGGLTHAVTLDRASTEQDAPVSEDAELQTGVVTATGIAERVG
jgi:hypothetical protein